MSTSMLSNPKSLVDSAFNVAVMSSMAVPEVGPAIAAGMAAGQALFDIFFQVPDRSDPGAALVTKNDLTNAINELKTYINEANFQQDLKNKEATILSINDKIREVWEANSSLNPIAKRGPLSSGQFSQSQVSSWKVKIQAYQQFIAGTKMLDIYNWIEPDKAHAHQTLGLYMLAASQWNLVCKINIAFEYNLALQDYQHALDQYNIDYNNYTTAHSAWKYADHNTRGPEPKAPIKPTEPAKDDHFLNGSTWATDIHDQIDRFINYAEPLVTTVENGFNSRQSDLDTRLGKIVKKDSGGQHWYEDTELGHSSKKVSSANLRDFQLQAYEGSIRVAMWSRLTDQYKLKGVKADDIDTMKKTLEQWKLTKKSVSPI